MDGAGRFVHCDLPGMLERSVICQASGDAGRAEGATTGGVEVSSLGRALDHAKHAPFRVGAVNTMRVGDLFENEKRWWLRLTRKAENGTRSPAITVW